MVKLTYKGNNFWVDEDNEISLEEFQVKHYREIVECVEAYTGGALNKDDAKFIAWISGWEPSTIHTFKHIIESSHRFGYISGEKDARQD